MSHEHEHHSPHADHGHDHGHRHGHGHGDDFDWEQLAEQLELDATLALPILLGALDSVEQPGAAHVADVGCGPGVFTAALAASAPGAAVTALDTSGPLLERVRRHAEQHGFHGRLLVVEGDLGTTALHEPADVVLASMVLHHVPDAAATLRHLHSQLRPGGHLVMLEFADPPAVGPGVPTDVWRRFEDAVTAARNARLGLDPRAIPWPSLLGDAGFVDITDRVVQAEHAAPLEPRSREWVARHIGRGIEFAAGQLADADVQQLREFAATVPARDDVHVRVERWVLTARRAPLK